MSVKITNEVCATGESSQPMNLGKKLQCIEGAVITGFLSKVGFSFPNKEDAKDLVKIKAAIANKDLVVLPEFETVEDDNTEATTVEKRTKTIVTKEGVAGSKYGIDASMCTYQALKTYQDSEYTRIFEITDASKGEEMTCDIDATGKVWGRKLTSTIVDLRTRTTLENDASVPLRLKFDNDVYSILATGNDYASIDGVEDVVFTIDSESATTIVVTATSGCKNDKVTGLVTADFKLLETDGTAQTIVASELDGVYTLTGTGLVTGTLETNGVITQTNAFLEAFKTAVTI